MSYYQEMQNKIRQEAIDWQINCDRDLSYADIFEVSAYFYKYGKRYGLLREFRENGIPC